MRHARIVRIPPAIAAALVMVVMILPASVATAATPAGGPTATVDAYLGDCEAFGTANLGPSDTLVIKHRRAGGTLVATHNLEVVDSEWDWDCPAPDLRSGDRLAFFIENDATPFKVLTIPALRLTTDRVANKVRGVLSGTPDAWSLHRYPCAADESCTWDGIERAITRDPSTGAFVSSIGGLSGLQMVQLSWSDQGDWLNLFQHVAQLIARPGSARVTGYGSKVGQKVTVTLKRGTTVVMASATTDRGAHFAVTLRKNGARLRIKAGDVLTASFASDATMRVPPSFVATDGSTVYGRCFKGAAVVYTVIDDTGHVDHSQSVTAELADGGWGWPDVVPSGWRIRMSCANAKGDVLVAETAVN